MAAREDRKNESSMTSGTRLIIYSLTAALILTVVIIVAALVVPGREPTPHARDLISTHTHIMGSDAAPVIIVEFGDFQCPLCRSFSLGPARQIIDSYINTGQVKLAYRHLAFLGRESVSAAIAAECAGAQGRFWEYHDTLFQNQSGENLGAFSDLNLKGFAGRLGLNMDLFSRCLDNGEYDSRIRQDAEDARHAAVRSTPTLFINSTMVAGLKEFKEYQMIIESYLANGE